MSQGKTGGLAGVIAGRTDICTVGKEGAGLTYRGYDIYDLADNASFEEVAHLLHQGHLPNAGELSAYRDRLKSLRAFARRAQTGIGVHPRRHPSHGRAAHGLLGAGQPGTGDGLLAAARRRRPAARRLPVHAAVLAPVSHRRQAHRDLHRRRQRRGSLPAPAARCPAERTAPAHARHLADFVCGARVQRLDLYRPGDRRHAVGTFTPRLPAPSARCVDLYTAGPTRRRWS